jgi:O-6-methylguanine DNA methyltransferase
MVGSPRPGRFAVSCSYGSPMHSGAATRSSIQGRLWPACLGHGPSATYPATVITTGAIPMIFTTTLGTPIGPMLAAAVSSDELGNAPSGRTGSGLCLLEFLDTREPGALLARLAARAGCGKVRPMTAVRTTDALDLLADELARYFAGTLNAFTVPLTPRGTAFQQSVWGRLKCIPFGRTTTYNQIANDLGRPGAQRAVGRANGANPIAIVIPCHRVINSEGGLHGYGGGLDRKRFLLDHEQAVLGPHLWAGPIARPRLTAPPGTLGAVRVTRQGTPSAFQNHSSEGTA